MIIGPPIRGLVYLDPASVGATCFSAPTSCQMIKVILNSVANSWQNFPASPAEKFGSWDNPSGPLLNFTFLRHLVWWIFCYLCLRAQEKRYNISIFLCTEIEGKSVHNRPKFCRSFVWPLFFLLFIRPFLIYAAEQSASWQHWFWKIAHTVARPGHWFLATLPNS
jgi:hypothetical protein